MARLADEGHRTVLVLATRGEHGEVDDGFLDEGETLAARRVRETHASAAVLGVSAVHFLGYVDSGMMGTSENDAPGSFWSADVEEAARALAVILGEEGADVVTVYDERGGYGHPDHIQVHRVGVRAAELAGVSEVYESTVNQTRIRERFAQLAEQGLLPEGAPATGEREMGMPEELLTTAVDVTGWLDRKRASMRAHPSQIAEQSFFLAMPDDVFAMAFGTEWYIHRGVRTPVEEFETTIAPAP